MRTRVISEGAQIAGDDVIEVAVALGEVESVAEHEVVFVHRRDLLGQALHAGLQLARRDERARRRHAGPAQRPYSLRAWRSMAARKPSPRLLSSASVSRACCRAAGFRCFSIGNTTCSKKPASRSAAVLYMRRWRA